MLNQHSKSNKKLKVIIMKKDINLKKSLMLFMLSFAIFGGYQLYNFTNLTSEEMFLLRNIEALAQIEQPNVADCINDPNYHCEALHPTDPSKDKFREYARW